MSDREQVLQQALSLSPEDRAYVVGALEDSLAGVDPLGLNGDGILLAELQRRSAAYEAGADNRACRRGRACRRTTAAGRRAVSVRLRILAEAEAEIEAAQQYLNSQTVSAGNDFLNALCQALDAIAERPMSFARMETLPRHARYRRALLARFHYAVVFEVLREDILIVALAHASRDPNYWLDRPR